LFFAERHTRVAVTAQRDAGMTLGDLVLSLARRSGTFAMFGFGRELPVVGLSRMVATRCAPALPELAIATSGSLDFSSCVLSGKDLADTADD
jgi:hypothetical protein